MRNVHDPLDSYTSFQPFLISGNSTERILCKVAQICAHKFALSFCARNYQRSKESPPPTSTTIAEELNLINVPPDNVQRFPKGFPNLPFANSIVDRCRAGIDLDSLMLAQERAWRVSKNKKKMASLIGFGRVLQPVAFVTSDKLKVEMV